jgi:hypothetical protein
MDVFLCTALLQESQLRSMVVTAKDGNYGCLLG